MKKLYLLRHADRESGLGLNVPLTEKGIVQALNLSKVIDEQGFNFDCIYCSPAKRTQDTALHAGLKNITVNEHLFEASHEGLFREIYNCDDNDNNLLIIGHAPSIPHIIQRLASPQSMKQHSYLAMGYRPCTLTEIVFDINSWKDIESGEITFVQEPAV
mgnify:CR=1 FL=1